jgi:AraC-like DNA-binding protein
MLHAIGIMNANHTSIWGQALVSELRKRGISDQSIVGNTGIDLRVFEADEARVRFDDLATLFERAADLTGDDLIGFGLGRGQDYRRGGLYAYTAISSPTVLTLLENLARYQRIHSEVTRFSADRLRDKGIFEWRLKAPHSLARRQYVEFMGTTLVDGIRRMTNRRVTPLRVAYRHFRKDNVKPVSMFFGCSVDYGSDSNLIAFKPADLDLPLQSADDYLNRMLRRFSEKSLKTLGRDTPPLVLEVEERIAADPTVSQDAVARQIGMSTRTLSRRLADAGTTFSDVVETYRESMAKRILSETDMQASEIAYKLGYTNQSTFSTAFKRWSGMTPTDYRKQIRR